MIKSSRYYYYANNNYFWEISTSTDCPIFQFLHWVSIGFLNLWYDEAVNHGKTFRDFNITTIYIRWYRPHDLFPQSWIRTSFSLWLPRLYAAVIRTKRIVPNHFRDDLRSLSKITVSPKQFQSHIILAIMELYPHPQVIYTKYLMPCL